MYKQKGFTLIELLVVIAIISVLSGMLMIAINPQSILQKSRDAKRMKDIESLFSAISLALSDGEITLTNTTTPCGADGCDQTEGGFLVNGTGYVRYTLAGAVGLSKFVSTLPRDPLSDTTHMYSYASDSVNFELNVAFEHTDNAAKMTQDGGTSNTKYEIGTAINVIN